MISLIDQTKAVYSTARLTVSLSIAWHNENNGCRPKTLCPHHKAHWNTWISKQFKYYSYCRLRL